MLHHKLLSIILAVTVLFAGQHTGLAQSGGAIPVARIICFEGAVTLDGGPVKTGDRITMMNKVLKAEGKDSYVGVLTEKGLTYLIKGQTEISVADLEEFVRKRRYEPGRFRRGGIHRSPIDLDVIGAKELFDNPSIYGKHICLKLRGEQVTQKYQLSVQSMFGDILEDSVQQTTSICKNLEPYFKTENALLVHFLHKYGTVEFVIKKVKEEDRKRVLHQLDLTGFDETELPLIRMAIYEMDLLFYDLFYEFYSTQVNESILSGDLKNFYARLASRYKPATTKTNP